MRFINMIWQRRKKLKNYKENAKKKKRYIKDYRLSEEFKNKIKCLRINRNNKKGFNNKHKFTGF